MIRKRQLDTKNYFLTALKLLSREQTTCDGDIMTMTSIMTMMATTTITATTNTWIFGLGSFWQVNLPPPPITPSSTNYCGTIHIATDMQ